MKPLWAFASVLMQVIAGRHFTPIQRLKKLLWVSRPLTRRASEGEARSELPKLTVLATDPVHSLACASGWCPIQVRR